MTTSNENTTRADVEVAAPVGLALPPDALMAAATDQLVEQATATGVALTGEGGLLTDLVHQVLQGALESEITDHLGYQRQAVEGRGSSGVDPLSWTRVVVSQAAFEAA